METFLRVLAAIVGIVLIVAAIFISIVIGRMREE